MAMELQQGRSVGDVDLDDFVAELTEAAYPVALRHKDRNEWLDMELDLWQVLAQTVKKWESRTRLPHSK